MLDSENSTGSNVHQSICKSPSSRLNFKVQTVDQEGVTKVYCTHTLSRLSCITQEWPFQPNGWFALWSPRGWALGKGHIAREGNTNPFHVSFSILSTTLQFPNSAGGHDNPFWYPCLRILWPEEPGGLGLHTMEMT